MVNRLFLLLLCLWSGRDLIGVSEMCIVQQTSNQEQFFMRFCTAVFQLISVIQHVLRVGCQKFGLTLTVDAVLYARSIFLLSRQWQLDHLASAATPKQQTQNYFQMSDFLDPSKIS